MTVFDSARRLMVVVAHPDDETFGCGSLLLRAADAGAVDRGVLCDARVTPASGPTDLELPAGGLAGQRERELYAAAELLGVSRVDVLGFGDSGMSGDAGPDTLVGADPVLRGRPGARERGGLPPGRRRHPRRQRRPP